MKKIKLLFLCYSIFYPFCGYSVAGAEKEKYRPDEIIVKFKKTATDERIRQINSKHNTSELYASLYAGFKILKRPEGISAEQAVEIYKNEPQIEYAELNYYAYTHFVPNDTYYWRQWNFLNIGGINIEPAWDITTGDPNIIVAVLDTGVAYENYQNFSLAPDLANTRFVAGYDFIHNDSHPNDDEGHGTHVTGTIAQSTNNSMGAAGIAFNCSLMPVKILNKRGEAPYSTVADGVYFAVDNGAKIINMSLGGDSNSITLKDAVAHAYNHGVTCICSAGNDYLEGNNTQYPAAYDDYCIAVGATRFDKTRAYYSNTGSYLDVVAPGGDINVDQNGDGWEDGIVQQTFDKNPSVFGYYLYQGTSMAAPHVTGVAALLASLGITNPDDIRVALQNTATDLGTTGWDSSYGWGLIDAFAAINYHFDKADFDKDGDVDLEDLQILCNNWLGDNPIIDITPPGGDGIIDFLDFADFADSFANQ